MQDALLTVLIQTSPIPSHPSTALIEALFRSFDHLTGLKDVARIIILCGGCDEQDDDDSYHDHGKRRRRKNQYKRGKISKEAACRYREYIHRLEYMIHNKLVPFQADSGYSAVEIKILHERHGSACAIRAAWHMIQTPFVMIAQHDNLFVSPVSLVNILDMMQQHTSWLKCLHFVSTATTDYINKIKRRYNLEIAPRIVEQDGCHYHLVPLVFWYGRTHIAQTQYYTDFVLNRPLLVGDHLEELLGVKQLEDVQQRGVDVAHGLYGNYLLDQGREVLYHLSGRRVLAEEYNPIDLIGDSLSSNDEKPVVPSSVTEGSLHSFTTARSCRAVVPGLQEVTSTTTSNNKSKVPTGRFRQPCFHCGVKGHSYKFCPNAQTQPEPEIVTL